jgi:hypothetical protein
VAVDVVVIEFDSIFVEFDSNLPEFDSNGVAFDVAGGGRRKTGDFLVEKKKKRIFGAVIY